MISILKGGTLEDKLRLAFLAYDQDHNGFIDRDELFQLLKTSSKARGLLSSDLELKNAVDIVFSATDKNKDGYLSYTEFKEAVLQNQVFINSFWTDSKHLLVFAPKNINYGMSVNQKNIGVGYNIDSF